MLLLVKFVITAADKLKYFFPLSTVKGAAKAPTVETGGRNRIGRREKWPKQSWEEGEIGGKVGGGRKRKVDV